MTRHDMIERVGSVYLTSNIEGGEYSYIQEAGSRAALEQAVGHTINHFKLDLRFEKDDIVVLLETKQNFKSSDEAQLAEYLEEEIALHTDKKAICVLANTNNEKIKVWKGQINDSCLLSEETVLDTMEYYSKLYDVNKQNDRESLLFHRIIRLGKEKLLKKRHLSSSLNGEKKSTTILSCLIPSNKLSITELMCFFKCFTVKCENKIWEVHICRLIPQMMVIMFIQNILP